MISDRELLKLAAKLSVSRTEVEWRCAASRAYFAAFHRARTLIHSLGFDVPRGDRAHAFLWRRMLSCGTTSIGMAGSLLSELRNSRNRADYDVSEEFPVKDARVAVESASDILQILDKLTPDDRHAAMETMRTYERDVLRETTWRQITR